VATFEQTALADAPAAPRRGAAFVPLTPTPIPTRTPFPPTRTPVPTVPPTATAITAPDDALAPAADGSRAAAAVPASGAAVSTGRPRTTGLGRPIPHLVAGKEACTQCHTTSSPGSLALPASHVGRLDTTCQACHAPS
jgi:hypothetical protein